MTVTHLIATESRQLKQRVRPRARYNDALPCALSSNRIRPAGRAGSVAFAVLVGGSAVLWAPFLRHCAEKRGWAGLPHPLEAYVESAVSTALARCVALAGPAVRDRAGAHATTTGRTRLTPSWPGPRRPRYCSMGCLHGAHWLSSAGKNPSLHSWPLHAMFPLPSPVCPYLLHESSGRTPRPTASRATRRGSWPCSARPSQRARRGWTPAATCWCTPATGPGSPCAACSSSTAWPGVGPNRRRCPAPSRRACARACGHCSRRRSRRRAGGPCRSGPRSSESGRGGLPRVRR